jgi:hypothetical protein
MLVISHSRLGSNEVTRQLAYAVKAPLNKMPLHGRFLISKRATLSGDTTGYGFYAPKVLEMKCYEFWGDAIYPEGL